MDFGITIIEVALIAICASPFIFMAINKSKNNKQHLFELKNLANQNECQIDLHDTFSNISIGLDIDKKHLFFIRNDNDIITQESINLIKIKACHVLKSNDTKAQKNISIINLVFVPLSSNLPDKKLLFFNIQTEMMLSGQLQLAEKWKEIIDNQLKK